MKQAPQLDQVQHEMRPGAITSDGFLGRDPRKLAEILEADNAAVQRLGLTHAQIAARLRELSVAGERGLGQAVTVEARFEVLTDSVRGHLPCPFLHRGLYPKTNTTVRNLASGETITYTDLNIHMIEAHGFYEGEGAPFRLNPAELVRILAVGA